MELVGKCLACVENDSHPAHSGQLIEVFCPNRNVLLGVGDCVDGKGIEPDAKKCKCGADLVFVDADLYEELLG